MPLDSRIILGAGVGVQPIDTPLEMEAKRAALAQVRQKALDDQQARAADNAFRQALQATGGDYDAAIQQSEQQGFNMLPMREAIQKQRKTSLDMAKQAFEQTKAEGEVTGGLMAKVRDQQTWTTMLPLINRIDPDLVQYLGPTYDENKFNTVRESVGSTLAQQHEWAEKALTHYGNGDYQKGFGAALMSTHSQDDLQGAIDAADAIGVPKYITNGYRNRQWSPEVQQEGNALALGAQKATAEKDTSAKVGSFEDYVTRTYGPDPTPAQILAARKAYGQADDRPRVSVSVAGPGVSDVKETVAGMMDGTLPPVLPGRATKEYNAILAESHRQKFDLAKAAQDWQATSKYLGTLNGAQQVRLRQAVEQVQESVPLVRSLVKEWDSAGIPVLSAANLRAAKAGTYGNRAQSLANRLDAQIADMTSELGTVYKGGNSSTDESLRLAAKNLGADWSKQAALDALDQIEKNIVYRKNSMKLGPVTDQGNRYAPDLGAVEKPAGETPQRRNIKGGGVAELRNGKWIRVQ